MRCPNCGNENPPDYMFCDECGARLGSDTEQAATSTSTSDAQPTPAIPGEGPESYPGTLPGVQPYVSPGFEPVSSTDDSSQAADADTLSTPTATEPEAEPVLEAANVDTSIADRGPASAPVPPPLSEDTLGAPSWDTAGAGVTYAPDTSGQAAMPDVVPIDTESPAYDSVAAAEAAEEVEPATAMPDYSAAPITSIPDTTTSAPAAEAGAATGTGGGGGGEWASEALLQLDTAQASLASGDWAAFASGMSALRATLQEAVQGAGGAPAAAATSMAGATQAPPSYLDTATATAEPSPMPTLEPAAEAGTLDVLAGVGMGAAGVGAGAADVAAMPDTLSGPMPGAGTGAARLVVISTGAELPLPEQEEITVGREDPSSGIFPDVDLTPYGGEDGGVSRRHARLLHIGGDYFVEDLQSTNYTKLDGQRLPAHVRERLEDGARLDFGRVAVIFRRS